MPLPDINIEDGRYLAFGNGNEWGYATIDAKLRHGADLALLGEGEAGAFNLGVTLSNWRANIVGGQRNHVFIIGDSNVFHVPGAVRWAQLIKTDLLTLSGLSDGGEGFRHLGLAEWSGTANWSLVTAGGIIDVAPNGFAYLSTNQANLLTWTRPGTFATFDRFDLWGCDDDFLSQEAQYSIDAGAFITTNWNFGSAPAPRIVPFTVTGNVTTTLRVRSNVPGFPTIFGGVSFYNGTSGLVVNNIAAGGGTTGLYVGPQTTSGDRLDLFDRLQPKLTIIWTGTNESAFSVEFNLPQKRLEDFYEEYTRLAQRARQYGDVLLIFPMDSGPNPSPFAKQFEINTQDQYERVARWVAHEQNCGFLSIRQRFGDYTHMNTRGYMLDVAHLTNSGQTLTHKAIKSVIEKAS